MKPSAVIPLVMVVAVIALGTAVGVLLSSMETRLASSEQRLAELEEERAVWEEHLDAVGKAAQELAALEVEQERLLSRMTYLEDAFDAADGRLDGLARDVRSLEEAVGAVRHDLLVAVGEDPEALPEQLVELEAQLVTLGEQVARLSQRVDELDVTRDVDTPPAVNSVPE